MNRRIAARNATGLALALYWPALFISTHVQLPRDPIGLHASDKLMHFVAYAGLAFLLCPIITTFRPKLGTLVATFFIVAAYGAVDELLQVPIEGRHGDIFDWLADLAGAAVGVLCFTCLMRVWYWLRSQQLSTSCSA